MIRLFVLLIVAVATTSFGIKIDVIKPLRGEMVEYRGWIELDSPLGATLHYGDQTINLDKETIDLVLPYLSHTSVLRAVPEPAAGLINGRCQRIAFTLNRVDDSILSIEGEFWLHYRDGNDFSLASLWVSLEDARAPLKHLVPSDFRKSLYILPYTLPDLRFHEIVILGKNETHALVCDKSALSPFLQSWNDETRIPLRWIKVPIDSVVSLEDTRPQLPSKENIHEFEKKGIISRLNLPRVEEDALKALKFKMFLKLHKPKSKVNFKVLYEDGGVYSSEEAIIKDLGDGNINLSMMSKFGASPVFRISGKDEEILRMLLNRVDTKEWAIPSPDHLNFSEKGYINATLSDVFFILDKNQNLSRIDARFLPPDNVSEPTIVPLMEVRPTISFYLNEDWKNQRFVTPFSHYEALPIVVLYRDNENFTFVSRPALDAFLNRQLDYIALYNTESSLLHFLPSPKAYDKALNSHQQAPDWIPKEFADLLQLQVYRYELEEKGRNLESEILDYLRQRAHLEARSCVRALTISEKVKKHRRRR